MVVNIRQKPRIVAQESCTNPNNGGSSENGSDTREEEKVIDMGSRDKEGGDGSGPKHNETQPGSASSKEVSEEGNGAPQGGLERV